MTAVADRLDRDDLASVARLRARLVAPPVEPEPGLPAAAETTTPSVPPVLFLPPPPREESR